MSINPKAGFVYSLLDTEDNSRKLGKSSNVEQRLKTVQTGNPHKLIIEYRLAVTDMTKAESSLHSLFAAKRLRKGKGEWFVLDTKDLTLLQKIFCAQDTTDKEYQLIESLGLR